MVKRKITSIVLESRQKPVMPLEPQLEPQGDNETPYVSVPPVQNTSRRRSYRKLKLLGGGLAISLAVLLAAAYYFHIFGFGLSKEERDQREALRYQKEVSQLIVMTSTETPVVASVTDAEGLRKSQAFYQNVAQGDVLLIYSTSQRAILYRPSTHMLVNVGPLYIDQESSSGAAAEL